MQWLFVRLLIECLAALTVLQAFFACRSFSDVVTTIKTTGAAGQLGIAVAFTLLVSAPIELIDAVIQFFHR